MVFQKRAVQQHRRRRRPWLCGGGNSDTEEVAVQSTISKTLNKQRSNSHKNHTAVDTRTGSSSTGGDESSSSGNDSRDQIVLNDVIVPAWKAENFLTAPLVDDDWWEDDNDDEHDDESSSGDSINEKCDVTYSDDDDDDDDDSRVANYVMQLQQQYNNEKVLDDSNTNCNEIDAVVVDSLNSSGSSSSNINVSSLLSKSKDGKRFCNRGLQTWYQARQKWLTIPSSKQQPDESSKLSSMKAHKRKGQSSSLSCPHIPESFRKELIQCLIDRRQFELSQSIPLSCVVDAYQEVWRENGCD